MSDHRPRKPVFHFLGSHRIHQWSSVTDFWWICCRRAKSTLTPPPPTPSFWPRTEKPWETQHVAVTNCCCAHWGKGLSIRAKLIIQVQFSVSAEVTELCHAVSENTGKTVGFAVLRSVFPQCCLVPNKCNSYCSCCLHFYIFDCTNTGMFSIFIFVLYI